MNKDPISLAAKAIAEADALLIGAGAGMGVDSGLPDFRGNEGFWKAYPPFQKLGLSFYDLADPIWFHRNPRQAWGFYGHRLNLYRATVPHRGFSILKDFGVNSFVFTSNVDGHFHASGFDSNRIVECHGAIHYLQCAEPCCETIWPAESVEIVVDEGTFLAEEPLPACMRCGGVARPNILMFGDACWVSDRTRQQGRLYSHWLGSFETRSRLVGLELGAGTAVPTVRSELERQTRGARCTMIRINPRESEVINGISIERGALDALQRIASEL